MASPWTDTVPDADTVQNPLPSAVGAAATVPWLPEKWGMAIDEEPTEWLAGVVAKAGWLTMMVAIDTAATSSSADFLTRW